MCCSGILDICGIINTTYLQFYTIKISWNYFWVWSCILLRDNKYCYILNTDSDIDVNFNMTSRYGIRLDLSLNIRIIYKTTSNMSRAK